jgi:HAD superfamily hydrolase (TIGR01509 family)
MSMAIRAVVFDLDGLMFDTEALFFRSAAGVMESRGKRFTPEIMRSLIGRRAVDVAGWLKELAGLDEPPDVILGEVRERFRAEVDSAVHPTPGLFVLLDHLHRRGLPTAVATSSGRSYADSLLTRHGVSDRFTFVLGSEDVTYGKPDPQIYRLAAERFGVKGDELLVLEDSPAGVAAGRGAGAVTVAVPHEHSPAEGLRAADLIVPRLDDPALLALIDGRPSRSDVR